MTEKKRYWLKLDKDFLTSPHMRVVKSMPNGKDYVIFYLSLMLESIETVGHLRFTSLIPYNDEMLSEVTGTNIDMVRSATKLFCEMGLMQIFDDGTIFMPEVPKMTGKECESAERVRLYRENKKQIETALHCNENVTPINNNNNNNKEEYNNNNNNKNINDDSSESSSELLREKNAKAEELERERHNFEEIYKRYPKKKGKAKAFDYYRQYLKGRKISTGTVKLTNEQMWAAVKKYKEEKESKDTELEFYQDFSTFMNKTILDYLEE